MGFADSTRHLHFPMYSLRPRAGRCQTCRVSAVDPAAVVAMATSAATVAVDEGARIGAGGTTVAQTAPSPPPPDGFNQVAAFTVTLVSYCSFVSDLYKNDVAVSKGVADVIVKNDLFRLTRELTNPGAGDALAAATESASGSFVRFLIQLVAAFM